MKYELNRLYNEDCLEAMKQIPDKYFDLAIVDPPHGLGDKVVNSGGRFKRYTNENGNWDKEPPSQDYKANERIEKETNQISIFEI